MSTLVHPEYSQYIGLTGTPITSAVFLERDMVRRFVQAVMDDDPLYYDDAHAAATRFGKVVAPLLFPVHMLRRAPGTPDPLKAVSANPDSDGTEGSEGIYLGLPPIETPFKRLLNGGSEIEFHQALRLGERVTLHSRYADVALKKGSSGEFLSFVVETDYRNDRGELLLVNRRTLIWR